MSAPSEDDAATKLQAIQRGRVARANTQPQVPIESAPIPEVAEWPPYCDPEYVMPEQFEVMGADDVLMINVTKFKGPKPYHGGYRHRKTGRIYHHAGTQSEKRGLIPEPRDVDRLKHRDTQTYEVKTRSVQVRDPAACRIARIAVARPRARERKHVVACHATRPCARSSRENSARKWNART